MVGSEIERIKRIFSTCLDAIKDSLGAMKTVVAAGKVIELGPDHFARLAAVKRFLGLVCAGRPKPKAPEKEERRGITLEELKELLKTRDSGAEE